MRYYLVLFDPTDSDEVIARATTRLRELHELAGLTGKVNWSTKTETGTGKTFGLYIDENTAKSLPAFVREFPGEWLDW